MARKLNVPTVHLNGSSKDSLCEALEKAADAVTTAHEVLRTTAPHGRDYYVQADPKAFEKATEQYVARLRNLESVYAELVAVWRGVDSGLTEVDLDPPGT